MMLTQTVSAPAIAPAFAVAPAPITVWYFVSVITDDLYHFYLELEEAYLGLGHKEQIHTAAQVRYPGCTVMDWMICRPQDR